MAEWVEWQLDYLLDNYNSMTNHEIGKYVGKSTEAIAQKLHALKLKRTDMDYLSIIRSTKRRALRRLFEEWDEIFKLPPKE